MPRIQWLVPLISSGGAGVLLANALTAPNGVSDSTLLLAIALAGVPYVFARSLSEMERPRAMPVRVVNTSEPEARGELLLTERLFR